jgi:hypothetical protein
MLTLVVLNVIMMSVTVLIVVVLNYIMMRVFKL